MHGNSPHVDARTCDDLADDQVTGQLTDDEEAAGGLGIGQEQQVLLGHGVIGSEIGAHPVEVAPRSARDVPAAIDSSTPSRRGTAAASMTAPTPEARAILNRCPSRPKP